MLTLLIFVSVRSFVLSFVLLLFACLRACLFFVRAFVCSSVRSFVYLSFAFMLRKFLVGNAMARVRRNRIYKRVRRLVGRYATTVQQNTKSPRKQQVFRFKRRRPPKARFQFGRPHMQPRRPDSSPEGPRK